MSSLSKYLGESYKSITSATDFATAGAANAWQAPELINLTLSKTTMFGQPWGVGGGPLASIAYVFNKTGEWHSSKFTGHALARVAETTTHTSPSTFSVTENKPSYDLVTYTVQPMQAQWDITQKAILDSIAAPVVVPVAAGGGTPTGNYMDETVKEWLEVVGNDMEYVAILGNASLNAVTYPLRSRFDGWDVETNPGTDTNLVNALGAGPSWDLFLEMYKAMPYQYRQMKDRLRWLVSTNVMLDWIRHISTRETGFGDMAYNGKTPGPNGIEMVEVPMIPDDLSVTEGSAVRNDGTFIWLCDPRNFFFFIRRNLERNVTYDARIGGGSYLLTLTVECDALVKTAQAVVKAYNISAAGTDYTLATS